MERGNAGAAEDRTAGGHIGSAHPACQQRLASIFAKALTASAVCVGIGHILRRQHHQHAVVGGILGDRLDCLGDALRRGVAQNVDRIVMAPLRREK
jgi:hypothetical protein